METESDVMDYNHARLKENEYLFQNKKYALTPLDIQAHVTSEASFERKYLTPKHQGGHERGSLLREAIAKIPSQDLLGKRVLDYCCGRGELAIYLSMRNAGAEVYGFDFADAAIRIAALKMQVNLNVA